MPCKYDDTVRINRIEDFAYCWLRNDRGERVRVQAARKTIEDRWKIDWRNEKAVVAEFHKRKVACRNEAAKIMGKGSIRIYLIP